MNRIKKHPVLEIKERKEIKFYFDGQEIKAFEGEMLSSALFAAGIKIFSYHKKDSAPQGIFCANGQCAQCSVIADGKVVKACVTAVKENMKVQTLRGAAPVSCDKSDKKLSFSKIEEIDTDVLILGAGPSGLACAFEIGKFNLDTIIVDDKDKPGGKLVLQTHKFFGSVEDCYAGSRGIDIADKLADDVKKYPSVKMWNNSVCAGVFSDKKIGVVKDGVYYLIKPKVFVVAAGAREKTLMFPGNTLPGVYGAGAFQTLVNRDLIKACEKIFIIGGGNVGLIAGYHAVQAGIKVVGLVEAAAYCGGYKVHEDKLRRLGVPIFTSHTVVEAQGKNCLESVTIAKVDENFKPIKGTEKKFKADTLLVAVGLNPVNEFYTHALESGINAFICGDAQEIAEASAAMFSGKIAAHKVLKSLGFITSEVPNFWYEKLEILKSRPGKTYSLEELKQEYQGKVYPVFHCRQEIPCNPCVTVCPKKSIKLSGETIMSLPKFSGECIGCFKCLVICPGLAVTIVDKRKDEKNPIVYLPYENDPSLAEKGKTAEIVDDYGETLYKSEIVSVLDMKAENVRIIGVKIPAEFAEKAASLRILSQEEGENWQGDISKLSDSVIVCRCERVTLGEIRKKIKEGVRDLNQLKALTRAGMGACGSKTCNSLLLSVMKSEGVDIKEITDLTKRPLFMETEFAVFAGVSSKKEDKTSFSGF
ncbi:MAG: 2Fe-2S iron-sulfur cluster-binding protein [Elusimicrobiota bacterium]